MSLWPPRRIDTLPPKWPDADGLVNANENRPWHTAATFKRLSSLRRRPRVRFRIIPNDAAHTLVESTWLVVTPPVHTPDKTPSARSLRRIPAMTAHQELRSRFNDGCKRNIRVALRLPAAVVARRPRPVISRSIHLHARVQPTTGEQEWLQKGPQRRPSTRPLTLAHAHCTEKGDGQTGKT